MSDTRTSKEIALSFLEHCFKFEIDEAVALLGGGATWWVLGNAEKIRVSGERDAERIRRLLETVRRGFPQGIRMEIAGVTAEGERVAIEAVSAAPLGNGKSYNNRYHFLIEVRGGCVMKIREYMDTEHAYQTQLDATAPRSQA